MMPTLEVARRLDVPVSTLHRWIDDGRIEPAGRLGHGTRAPMFFDPEVVEAFAAELAAEAEARAATLRGEEAAS